MYGFWNLLAGYVIVEARGLGMERLLNRATAAGIRMEQVERRSYTVMRMRVRKSWRRVCVPCRYCGPAA